MIPLTSRSVKPPRICFHRRHARRPTTRMGDKAAGPHDRCRAIAFRVPTENGPVGSVSFSRSRACEVSLQAAAGNASTAAAAPRNERRVKPRSTVGRRASGLGLPSGM